MHKTQPDHLRPCEPGGEQRCSQYLRQPRVEDELGHIDGRCGRGEGEHASTGIRDPPFAHGGVGAQLDGLVAIDFEVGDGEALRIQKMDERARRVIAAIDPTARGWRPDSNPDP